MPWEERKREALQYQSLVQDCKDRGWQAGMFPVESSCRGFPARSVCRLLSALGLDERSKKQAAHRMGEEAERASRWLWSRREEGSWKTGADDLAITAGPATVLSVISVEGEVWVPPDDICCQLKGYGYLMR